MRWFVSAVLALLLGWGWYMASPYVAIVTIVRAVDRGDAASLADRINLHAVRLSLAQQLATEGVDTRTPMRSLSQADRQLAASAIAAAAHPALQRFVTAHGVLDLLRGSLPQDSRGTEAKALPKIASEPLLDLVAGSRWRGFRTIYFTLPPGRSTDQRFRLQFRLSRFKWKLVGIDLPYALRQRLSLDLFRRTETE